ncbi:TonB family protein [Microbacteriaceae bacterium K1510]|nr:TonB family protein [Microbacteriaceae bacterium K1510]
MDRRITEILADFVRRASVKSGRMRRCIIRATFVVALAVGSPCSSGAQSTTANGEIAFDIPAQPLARALIAYGAATGVEIFYNAALADNQRSTAVKGVILPSAALQVLLRGTGYIAKSSGVDTVTIVPVPPEAAPAVAETRKKLQPYFAAVQARLSDTLCRNGAAVADEGETLLQIWLSSSGAVARAEVIDEEGQPARDQSAAMAIKAMTFVAPPADMPQPINIVIFPPFKASKTCGAANTMRRAG